MKQVKWLGDHDSLNAIADLGVGVMEDENGYDLEIHHNGKCLKVRMDQYVILKDDQIFVQDTRCCGGGCHE